MEVNKIQVFLLDPNNVYVGSGKAYELALAPGIYNVPFRSVTVEPALKEGFLCVWESPHPPQSLDFSSKGQWRYVAIPDKEDVVMPTLRADDPPIA